MKLIVLHVVVVRIMTAMHWCRYKIYLRLAHWYLITKSKVLLRIRLCYKLWLLLILGDVIEMITKVISILLALVAVTKAR